MTELTVLNAAAIEELLTIPMAVDAVEQAYLEKYKGDAALWPMVFHEFDPGHADLDIKSGNLDGLGFYGLKVVSWFGTNPGKSLPALYGTSLLFDLAVIAVKNTELALVLVLVLVLPLLAVFTRHVQKRMLAAQLDNRRAVAAVSGQVPETLHNIRTIRALGLENYMARRYDRRSGSRSRRAPFGRNHRQSGRRDRGLRAGGTAPCVSRAHRPLHFPPDL